MIVAISTSCLCNSHDRVDIKVQSVTLNKTSTTLDIGCTNTETLTANVWPETATDKSVAWSSSDPEVATVESNGKISAVAEGTAAITVKTNDGGKTATCEVTVENNPNIVITANKDSTLTLVNSENNSD